MIPAAAVQIIGILLLVVIAWRSTVSFIAAKPADRKKLIIIYAIVGVISIIAFFGTKQSGLSERLFPDYYNGYPVEEGPIDWRQITPDLKLEDFNFETTIP